MTVAGEGADIPGGALPDNRVLLILAADHRDSLERGLYGLTAPPTPAQRPGSAPTSCCSTRHCWTLWHGFPPRSSRGC